MNINEQCLLNYLKNNDKITDLSLLIEKFLYDHKNNASIDFNKPVKG